jgi:hypothetical protein
MKADWFERRRRVKVAFAVLAVAIVTSGALGIILVLMGRKHPGF